MLAFERERRTLQVLLSICYTSMSHQRYSAFLVLLRQARLDVGMTQADVARKLGVPQSYVSKCESGVRRMDVTELHAWLDAVDRDWVTFTLALGGALDAQGLQSFPESRF